YKKRPFKKLSQSYYIKGASKIKLGGNKMNKGYVGYSRSVRSQRAIESFEMPLSFIKKAVIMDFLEEHKEEYGESDLTFLKKLAVTKWKFIAIELTASSSWHHTSSYFNK